MYIDSRQAEEKAVLDLAYAMCVAARTAPKTRGRDHLETAILTGEDKDRVVAEMRRLGEVFGESAQSFIRDAVNVEACPVVVLIGAKYLTRGLEDRCGLCRFENCAACAKAGAACVYTSMDLGIALGSAVALAADQRVDNRIMFSIGQAAASLGLLGDFKMIMGIPLSATGKSPFFDRG
ncbi:MAG: DUF2148 domain-containing protein [Propionibacteriaceae bacterium]|jgi:uncharacterized ferredoxin-like protein|nr:DUF2148 domain-containing protein [Propionibacteriaceae bacterium]